MDNALHTKASTHYATIEALLKASIAESAIPESYLCRHNVFEFVDPAFKNYLIRTTTWNPERYLKASTSLTPAKYIFHGPNIGNPLFVATDENGVEAEFSIMRKQEGQSFSDLGSKALVEHLAANPEKLDHLFRTVAFLALHEKTVAHYIYATQRLALDLNYGNLFIDDHNNLSIIDQMAPEDIKHRGTDRFMFRKSENSINWLKQKLEETLEEAKSKNVNPDALKAVEQAVELYAKQSIKTLVDAQTKGFNSSQKWEYLTNKLSDPGQIPWRGLEDGETKSNVFKTVRNVLAAPIPLRGKNASPQKLLDMLNALSAASIVPSL